MKYSELEKLLRKAGCYNMNKEESGHPLWYSPKTNNFFAMSHHHSREVASGTLITFLKAAGIRYFKTRKMKKKCTAHIECNKDGFYSVYTEDEFPFGFFGEGNTAQKAQDDFLNLFDAMRKEHFQRTGEMVEAEFAFVYDASAFLQHYKGILTLSGLSRITGINKVQLSQYVCGRRRPSKKTQQRIKASVVSFAEELKHAMA